MASLDTTLRPVPPVTAATAATAEHLPDTVSAPRAARALGLSRRQLDVAVRLGLVATEATDVPWLRRVSWAEIERLRADPGFPVPLRDQALLVNATEGADMLGVTPARFARLARGGCLAPLSLYPHRGAFVWRYPAIELRTFAERHPELLSGPVPEALRSLLREGADWRPRRWRARHTGLLAAQARSPWERAAVPAAVLHPRALRALVPDQHERALLRRLRPPLCDTREEAAREVLPATDPDETRWYGTALTLALRDARRVRPGPLPPPRISPHRALRTGRRP
ncbi:DUF6397 family protein [Streptomyces sp. B6B3]|uniref:DUF6397 family protein n=1 Tax=Streptomyces sp. B6B3 TaxID=3153570 RepID=UPI00325E36BF